MCGFLAVLLKEENMHFSKEHLNEIKQNTRLINYRGPAIEGYCRDNHMALGFQGLQNIEIETSPQPYYFDQDRYCMVFDGKIFNNEKLRICLSNKGYEFVTEKDDEIISMLFLDKGVHAFTELRGMFSIIIWDTLDKKVYGARDRFGIKPLYYTENEGKAIFASEKRSILFSNHKGTLAQEPLHHYFTYQYVPEPMTLIDGIRKIKPGHYFIKEMNEAIQFKPYFHASFDPINSDQRDLKKQIRDTLMDSVNVHMNNELPTGSFLSGGIDSSLIVAIAKQVNPNLKTFSVGFEMDGYSEVDVAKETADILGVNHISHIISPEEYVSVLPEIMWHLDAPLADPSCVPLFIAAREASKHVKVILSGEGADEIFGGYNIYKEYDSLKLFRAFPEVLNKALQQIAAVFPEGMKGKSFIERGTTPLEERYIGNAKMFTEEEKSELLKQYNRNFPSQALTGELYDQVRAEHTVTQMQYIDMHMWLPGDILLKADRLTMAHSLDLRVPFLDKEVFKVARTIPVHAKIANGTTKLILRKAFKGFLPNNILCREKLGFPVPISGWLKRDLYEWARQLIFESPTEDIIDKQLVIQLLDRHAQNKGNNARKIWTVLMFMLWYNIHIEYSQTFDLKKVVSKV